jgi:hypothetical protein
MELLGLVRVIWVTQKGVVEWALETLHALIRRFWPNNVGGYGKSWIALLQES